MGRDIAVLDARLLSIKPPKNVRRAPRSLKERKFWKAKEFENWTLYYSVPVLSEVQPSKYLSHWALLVEALHLMLQQEISSADVDLCELLMLEFVVKTQQLYSEQAMTFNVHQMEHIVKSVRLWGPLWAHSAFPFEAGNGKLKSCIKAAKGIPHQICRTLALENVVCELEELVTSSAVSSYCLSLVSHVTQKSVCLQTEGVRLLGKGCPYQEFTGVVPNPLKVSPQAAEYQRMLKWGTVYTTASYVGNKRNNSSVAKLSDGLVGTIEKIVLDGSSSFVVFRTLECLPYRSRSKRTLFKVRGHQTRCLVVPSSEVISPVVYMPLGDISYVVPVPSALTF